MHRHQGPASGLRALAAIDGAERLRDYPFYAAARGELELRVGQFDAARAHFLVAIARARNNGELRFLLRRLAACTN